MRRGLRAATLILVVGVAPALAILAAAPGCKDCAVIPCPTPGFDPDACRCRPPIDASAVDGDGGRDADAGAP